MTYPRIMSEERTLSLVSQGRSLSRFGDGEFALAENRGIRNQKYAPELSARLRGILQGDGAPCLVGIPNLLAPLPQKKQHFWRKYQRCAALLHPSQCYGSSFITRPDNAPWIDTPSYWALLESLWAGRHVTLVRGTDPTILGTGAISLMPADLTTAKSVREVIGPAVNAWTEYPALMEHVGRPELAILCLGVTATVMAVDLCAKGVHAIDLGHVGTFLYLKRGGEPMDRIKSNRKVA